MQAAAGTPFRFAGPLAAIAKTIAQLRDRYLAQATGSRQKALLEPPIDRRPERTGSDLGRIMHQATSVLDDRSVADRIADLQQDASLSWQDPAHLRLLGRTVVNERHYQGERKGRTDTAVRTGPSDLYAGAVEAAIVQDPERTAVARRPRLRPPDQTPAGSHRRQTRSAFERNRLGRLDGHCLTSQTQQIGELRSGLEDSLMHNCSKGLVGFRSFFYVGCTKERWRKKF